jgi:hypothetical protein
MNSLEEMVLQNIVVLRCLREWIDAEIVRGIIVDAPEAIEMHNLMEKVIRIYQEEVAARRKAQEQVRQE